MKTHKLSKSFAAITVTALAIPMSWGATLMDNTAIALGGGVDVSIPTGSYSTLGGGGNVTSFNNPIIDYAFYKGTTAFTTSGATLISDLSAAGGSDSKLNLWETSVLTDPADSAGNVRSKDGATFTVDISGLTSGSIYIFNGSWQARTDWFDVSMTGADQTAVTTWDDGGSANAVFGFAGAASGQVMHAKQIDFTDAADYDTITFTIQESGSQDGYFAGVVVTSLIPEPSSTALLGLGGLALILRRRK